MSDTTQPGVDNALDLDAIEAAARAATPGPWVHRFDPGNPAGVQHGVKLDGEHGCWVGDFLDNADRSTEGGGAGERNAAFIAAANPQSVLALIALARRAAQPVEAASQQDELRTTIRTMATALNNGEWANLLTTDPDLSALDAEISNLVSRLSDAATHPSEPAVPAPDATITLSGHQLRMALDLINPDGARDRDQLDDELTFGMRQHRDDEGKVGTGMCCWNDDTDGVLPLDGEYPWPAVPAVGGEIVAGAEPTEEQIIAAARVLSDRSATACNVNKLDNWDIYGGEFIDDARAALKAAFGEKS